MTVIYHIFPSLFVADQRVQRGLKGQAKQGLCQNQMLFLREKMEEINEIPMAPKCVTPSITDIEDAFF